MEIAITLSILYCTFFLLRYITVLMDYYCLVHELEDHYNGKLAHYISWIYSIKKVFWNNLWYHNEIDFFIDKSNYNQLLIYRALELSREYEEAESLAK